MIIIVEGPDNAGKTTLALHIAKAMRACFLKVERPSRGVDLIALRRILETAESYSGVVVADRHVCISEPIYGKIIRGGHDLDDREVELSYDQIDVLIYCRPPMHAIMSSIQDRPQMEGVIENTQAIIHVYDEVMQEIHLEQRILVRQYDYTKDDRDLLVAHLKQYQEAHAL